MAYQVINLFLHLWQQTQYYVKVTHFDLTDPNILDSKELISLKYRIARFRIQGLRIKSLKISRILDYENQNSRIEDCWARGSNDPGLRESEFED